MRGIIEFWRAVEMFSPPSDSAGSSSARRCSTSRAGEPMPWDAGHPVQRIRLTKDQVWRHTVYVGLYPREAMFSALKDVFPTSTDSYEERPSGESALLAFALSAEGTLLEGSAVLSEGAWATARALDPGPSSAGWLDGFEGLEADFALRLEEMYLRGEDGVASPWCLTGMRSRNARAAIASLGVADVLPVSGIRVSCEIVARRSADTVEHDFLNSFIADDLARVAAPRREARSALHCATTCGRPPTSTPTAASTCAPGSTRSAAPPTPVASARSLACEPRIGRWRSGSSSPSTRPPRCRATAATCSLSTGRRGPARRRCCAT